MNDNKTPSTEYTLMKRLLRNSSGKDAEGFIRQILKEFPRIAKSYEELYEENKDLRDQMGIECEAKHKALNDCCVMWERLNDLSRFNPPSDDEDECREILGGQAWAADKALSQVAKYE